MFSGGADRALVAFDLNAQKVVFQKQNAHKYARVRESVVVAKRGATCSSSQPTALGFSNVDRDGLTCMAVHEHLVTTGDEEGGVKLWDLRQTKQLFSWKENDDFISDLAIVPNKNTILAPRCEPAALAPTSLRLPKRLMNCSGDGTLSVFHMRKAGLESQSDNMEDELLSVAVIKVRPLAMKPDGDDGRRVTKVDALTTLP